MSGEGPTLCIVINKTHHKSKNKAWKNAALQHSSTQDENLKLQLKHQEHLREYHEMIALEKFLENCKADKPSEVVLYLGPIDENTERKERFRNELMEKVAYSLYILGIKSSIVSDTLYVLNVNLQQEWPLESLMSEIKEAQKSDEDIQRVVQEKTCHQNM